MGVDLSLFKMADVMQVPITYQGGTVSGKRGAVFNTPIGLSIPFEVKVQKMFEAEQCGVLVHVLGNLYMVVAHYQKTGAVSCYLIDSGRFKDTDARTNPGMLMYRKMDLRGVIESFREALVKAFYWKGNAWKPLTIPK